MEEDGGVKATTVTRLRRRLSVEQSEDGNGSPAQSTPTKKRGGRLAAKPQLDLIDENIPVSSPRKTRRKSIATEAEEKPITPSRRSARIKSNSSIVSETQLVLATDSPRAKRAARRNSQAGSDNEGPATPARQTRRTRKDSASSVENLESATNNKPLPVVEMVIEEEPENELQKAADKSKSSAPASEELSPNSARKSRRLLEKRNRRSGSFKSDQDTSNKSLNISITSEKASPKTESVSRSPLNKSGKSKKPKDDLSESNMSLLNKLDTEAKLNKSDHNKSLSSLNTEHTDKSKRNRTESWPTVRVSEGNESINLSDNELSKKKKNKSNKLSADSDITKINKSDTSVNEENVSKSVLNTSPKRKKSQSDTSFTKETEQSKDHNLTNQALTPRENSVNMQDVSNLQSDNANITSVVATLFDTAPENVQATVYFEDSDSNSTAAVTADNHIDSEDQCVPVVEHDFKESLSPQKLTMVSNAELILSNEISKDNASFNIPKGDKDVDNSCEPMDIDETIQDDILQNSLQTHETSKTRRKSSMADTSVLSTTTAEEETNKSKRKTSISNSTADTLDRSKAPEDEHNKSKRKSSISNATADTSGLSKTTEEETNKSKSSNAANTSAVTMTSQEEINKSKRKSSPSYSVVDGVDRSKTADDENNRSKRKSSISSTAVDTSDLSKTAVEVTNKSKRKSSISNTVDTSDRSKDENKSTLILSQIRDVSSTSENPNSPKPTQVNEVLSKSAVNVNSIVNKKIARGNLSLNDVEGTPKQRNIQKLTMQTSTPIVTQEPDVKAKGNKQNNSNAKSKANFSKSVNDSESSEEESEDESSLEKSKLLNDEAEEVSDDYESGDSQDEEERKYEDENEIVERGETLSSDDDISNDTDYEKDSFIVSSDPEDNELLSGSGDDLDMSDNELTMSQKSKKKFNERKLKEQKNASREMFESRHKLNTSDQNPPTPKTKKNRMRIDSSLLASDEEEVVKPKTHKRMRLDSTLDTSAKQKDTEMSLNESKKKDTKLQDNTLKEVTNVSLKKSKKNKSIQDSISNQSGIDEKEITIYNESTINNPDPLQVNFKQEPKTPQKDLNISVVQFTDRKEIENVQISGSNSVLNQTGTDPLQTTIVCEESDSSESEEIMQNFDSVLNNLNKNKKTKLYNKNISLIMDHKSKKKPIEPIIDQLNLTHAKNNKKKQSDNKNHSKDVVDSNQVEIVAKTSESDDDNESSNSIDLKLLFSEDNLSEDECQQNKDDDDSIPLKKTSGKTNIRESIGNASPRDSPLNESSKKKNKLKSSIPTAASNEEGDSSGEAHLNKSTTKKKKSRSSLSLETPKKPEEQLGNESVLNKSSSKKNKKRTSLTAAESLELQESIQAEELNTSKSKKKKQITSTVTESAPGTLDIFSSSFNDSSAKKKKKHSISKPTVEESQDILNKSNTVNVSLNASGLKVTKKHSKETQEQLGNESILDKSSSKKNKQRTSLTAAESQELQESIHADELNKSISKKKKQRTSSVAESAAETLDNLSVSLNESSVKKKKKRSISEPAVEESHDILNTSKFNVSLNESGLKKKKKRSVSAVEETQGDLFFIDTKGMLKDDKETGETNTAWVSKTEKKNPRKIETLVDDDSDGAPDEEPYHSVKATEADLHNTETATESAETGSGKKKKKKKKKSAAAANQSGHIDTVVDIASNSKKRKRKSSNAESSQIDIQESVETVTLNEAAGSQKKKRKTSHNEDKNSSGTSEPTHAKKKNKKNIIFQEAALEKETVETHIKTNKKRKNRDDDGDTMQVKVSKVSSFQEVHVPRLPDKILSQLDDKPRKRDTAAGSRDKVVSTSNFIVETARQKRAKPSNYLEESVYLDADSPIAKKEKPRIKKPKVLPFIPTASLSGTGFTTNFKINKLSQATTKFEAEPLGFSKESYLQKKGIKKLGTYDQYKKQIRHKLSKF